MSSLADIIAQAIDGAGGLADDATLAEMVSESLTDVEYRSLTLWLLTQEIRRTRRNTTRHIEEACFATSPGGRSADPAADRRSWLDERILVPGRPPTTWGEATIEDHAARIDYLSRLSSGIVRTIDRHKEAIGALKRAKARCLAELHAEEERAA